MSESRKKDKAIRKKKFVLKIDSYNFQNGDEEEKEEEKTETKFDA